MAADGVKAFAAPLPLTIVCRRRSGARPHARARATGPVILAAHAYAGAVIAATRTEKVKGLVYVTALAPDEGETVADVFYRAEAASAGAQARAGQRTGLIWLPEEAFPAAFAQNASAEELGRARGGAAAALASPA